MEQSRVPAFGIEHPLSGSNLPLQLGMALAVGIVLGLVTVLVSPLWAFLGLVGLGFGLLVLQRSDIALLGILIATSSIVFEEALPQIPIGVGSLHIPDILLVGSLGLIVVRLLVERDYKFLHTPLDWPLILFLGAALTSTILAIFRDSVSAQLALRSIRVVVYYLTFFVVTNLVRTERQLKLLTEGITLLATVVAGAMVLQFLLGNSVAVLPGRVETLRTGSETFSGITRILPPGQSLVFVGFILVMCKLVIQDHVVGGVLRVFQWGLLSAALVLTFNRSFWVVSGLAMVLLALLAKRTELRRLLNLALVVLTLLLTLSLLFLSSPDSPARELATAATARLGSLFDTNSVEESSVRWRFIEQEYAYPQIFKHPILGLGLATNYRPLDPRIDFPDREWDARNYIHNGHLGILIKTGVLGYLGFLVFSLLAIVRGFRFWRSPPSQAMRATVLAFTLAYVGVLLAGFVIPAFLEWFWIPVLGMMLGVNEAALRLTPENREQSGVRLSSGGGRFNRG